MDTTALARQHLERRLMPLRERADLVRPPKGWVRAIREALGMTTRQFGARLGRAQSNAVVLEQREASDTISLGLLRQAAEALDCTLVYALVPNRSLDETLRARAALIADRKLAAVDQTMALENQSVDAQTMASQRKALITELLRDNPTRLWDEL